MRKVPKYLLSIMFYRIKLYILFDEKIVDLSEKQK